MMQQMTPRVRFAEFEDQWSDTPFGVLAERRSSVTATDDRQTVAFDDVLSGTGTLKSNRGRDVDGKVGVPFQTGDVLFGKLRPYLKNWLRASFDGVALGDFWVLRPTDSDSSYLYAAIQRPEFMSVANISSGTKMPRSDWGLVSSSTFGAPHLQEQQRIGGFFAELDSLLDATSKEIEKLKALKATMLTKMFPQGDSRVPEIRFDEFDGEWSRCELGEVAQIVGGGTPSTTESKFWDGNIDWYSPTEIDGRIEVRQSTRRITDAGYASCSASLLPADRTILFTSRASIGKTAILRSPACTNQGFQSLVLNEDTDVYFVYSMSYQLKAYAERNASGSTFLEVSSKTLAEGVFAFPEYREQQAIGRYFEELDNLIVSESEMLEKLRHLKSAFLRSMFV